jgi:hypothetical protein
MATQDLISGESSSDGGLKTWKEIEHLRQRDEFQQLYREAKAKFEPRQ